MNVYIGGAKDYSAMRGPCPDGFHVPLESECEAMYNMGISLGAWTSTAISNVKTYLKLPPTGLRFRNNGTASGQGDTGVYWSASISSSNLCYCFGYDGSNVFYNIEQYKSLGRTIRAFKNTPVAPDNTWTVLKAGTGNAGIFWSSTLGLISISSNGTTWITIADKNLGATTVYSDGATLSEANCGKYFQWGNNYGFPFTGSVTTSSTKVNAQNYGPGNYYSSSTFITVDSGTPNSWDSSNNKNLRGGVTGIVSPAELKNAYIGEVYEYSYDFRNKTISQVQADGWNIFDGLSAATINSYGISLTNGQELRAKIDKSGILNNARKITMEMIATLDGYSASRFSYYKTATSSTRDGLTGPRYANSGYHTTIYSVTTTDSVSLSGTATMTTVIDLENKTWITTSSKGYSRSGTLTDEQVSNIRNNTNGIYINVSVNGGIGYIYTLVEY